MKGRLVASGHNNPVGADDSAPPYAVATTRRVQLNGTRAQQPIVGAGLCSARDPTPIGALAFPRGGKVSAKLTDEGAMTTPAGDRYRVRAAER